MLSEEYIKENIIPIICILSRKMENEKAFCAPFAYILKDIGNGNI